MKGILSKLAAILSIIGGLAAIIALYFQWQSRQHEMGGMLNASYQSRLLNNRESKTIIVCLEDTTIDLSNLYVTPTFDNPSQYSINDFSLTYSTESENVNCSPSSFYQKHTINKHENIYKYTERVLDAHGESPKPFISFDLNSDVGRCLIKAKATYDGAPSAFEYSTDIWFIVEPNDNNLSFENWKLNCKKRIYDLVRDNYYDVFYFKKGMPSEYQFDVALSNKNIIEQKPNQSRSIDDLDTLTNTISNTEEQGIDENLANFLSIDHHIIDRNKKGNSSITVFTKESAAKNETIYALYEYNYSVYRCHYWNKVNLLKGQNKFSFQLKDDVDDIEELYLCHRVPANLVINIKEENDSTVLVSGRTKSITICELPYSEKSSYIFVIFGEGTKSLSTKGSDISKLKVYISDKDYSWPFSISLVYSVIRNIILPLLFHIIGVICAIIFIIILKEASKTNYRQFFKHSKTWFGYYRLILRVGVVLLGVGYLCWFTYYIITCIIS